ncbi:hypothetical protein AK812_SmicGene43191 [Symbiodinium microadriaticum]|uniref:Uncharacterized protein n=1 Tax=Symbiodinium microadriaticum TaxID=2951 RepID=A0A1Q9C1N7_SYMMI|nr:hypothetical protein AK812_SmicGene43191 [Symbiodinium microadriaticum]
MADKSGHLWAERLANQRHKHRRPAVADPRQAPRSGGEEGQNTREKEATPQDQEEKKKHEKPTGRAAKGEVRASNFLPRGNEHLVKSTPRTKSLPPVQLPSPTETVATIIGISMSNSADYD